MISEKIKGGILAINSLAGSVGEHQWQVLDYVRHELADAAEMTEAMETRVPVEMLARAVQQHRREIREEAHA